MNPIATEYQDLLDERTDLADDIEAADTDAEQAAARSALDEWDAENGARLALLAEVCTEGEDTIEDWPHCHLFTDTAEHAEEFARDMGWLGAPSDGPLFRYVDWEQVWEKELRFDFSCIELDGVTYWGRSN